jgi:FkbM family methyltransferase
VHHRRMNLTRARQRVVRNRIVRAAIRPFLPVFPRRDLERLGSVYGGWWIPTSLLDADSVVYSAGIGGDASFDLELMRRFGCQVLGLDPTPYSIAFVAQQDWPPQWHFEPVGLWSRVDTLSFAPMAGKSTGSASITRAGNGAAAFSAAVEPLPMIMARHGHKGIDVLKMDIEGAEGPVLDALLDSDLRPRIVLVEFDQPEAPWALVARVRRLLNAGYELNHVELWNYTFTKK